MGEAKVVKKNQWMRVIELYGVMMIVISISYIIYSIFRDKEDPTAAGTTSNDHHRSQDEE